MAASSFWANKADSRKTVQSPPAFAVPSTPTTKTLTAKKNGLVLKPMKNGANNSSLPTTNGKQVSWADSEDDEEYLGSLGTDKPGTTTAFTALLQEKDSRISDLEMNSREAFMRIKQLEDSMTKKSKYISELERTVKDIELSLSELKSVVSEKNSRLNSIEKNHQSNSPPKQELMGKVDEKNHQSNSPPKQELVAKVDEKNRGIAVLETDRGHQAATVGGPETQAKEVPKQIPTEKASVSGSDSPISEADFPTFVTRDTVKTVSPDPAPKKLKFPIDFNKYGKKSVQPPSPTNKTQPAAVRGGGLASKAVRDPKAAAPKFNPSLDIRHMPLAQRALFANGPEVAVQMGNVKLGALPKFILMQCSNKAYLHFTHHPSASSFVLPADSMDVEAAKLHIKWMDEMTYQSRVYSLPLHTEQQHDAKNLRICRAARILGLNNAYVGHFTRQLCDRIRDQQVTPAFAHLICTLVTPDNDPIFNCLAQNLVYQRTHRAGAAALNPQVVEALQARHPLLASKMAAITKRREEGAARNGA